MMRIYNYDHRIASGRLQVGKVYMVEKRGAFLHTLHGEKVQLRDNDLVKYMGKTHSSGGEDPYPTDIFEMLGGSQGYDEDHPHHGKIGTFHPNKSGNADMGFLSPYAT